MNNDYPHDLAELMQQVTETMASDYNRIRKRSKEDPGTAGDKGEEDWAVLLREWLPPTLKVVTKGRIIGLDGISTSPQVDIIVLKDVYPKKMIDKKLYLISGVAAAFECKTTLRSTHIADVVKASVKIKQLNRNREGNPYVELHAPPVFGLLAHSHSWTKGKSRPEQNITKTLLYEDRLSVSHPRECLDLICVADLGVWSSWKMTYCPPSKYAELSGYGKSGAATSGYAAFTYSDNREDSQFTPIGRLIAYLSRRLAWEIPSLRSLADYYYTSPLHGGGVIRERLWTSAIYSDSIRNTIERGPLPPTIIGKWDEWNRYFL